MLRCLLLTITTLLAVVPCHAQPFWQKTSGPQEGEITSLAIDSAGVVYLAGSTGFKSFDNGETWVRTQSQSLYMSGTELAAGDTPGVLYSFFTGLPSGLLRSTDQGRTWTRLSGPSTNAQPQVYALAIKRDTVFLSDDGNVRRYIHSSSQWDDISIVPGGASMPANLVSSFAIAPTGEVFAASRAGVYRSIDNGETWTSASTGLGNGIVRTLHAAGNADLYAATDDSLFRSTGGGSLWTAMPVSFTGRGPATITTKGSNLVLVGTHRGFFIRSEDRGTTWSQEMLPEIYPQTTLVAPDGSILIGSIYGGLFRSTDDGETWTRNNVGLSTADVSVITAAPNGMIYAFGGSFNGLEQITVIWRTGDRGETWIPTQFPGLGPCGDAYSVVLLDNDVLFGAGCGSGIYRTTDSGATWTNQPVPGLDYVAGLVLLKSGDLLASAKFGRGLYRSTDKGGTWKRSGEFPHWVMSMFVHSSGRVLVGSRDSTIHYSEDNGATWMRAAVAGTSDRIVSMTEDREGRVFAGSKENGVYVSTDGGVSWRLANTSTLTNYGNNEVAILADRNGDLFLVGYEYRLLRSIDHGATWNEFSSGTLGRGTWKGLARDSSGYLWVSGAGSGVYRSTRATASVRMMDVASSTGLRLVPNPLSSTATFSFTLRKGGDARLKIYDLQGNLVSTVVDGRLDAGEHDVAWNAETVMPGTYYYRLTLDGKATAGKFIVAR